MWLINNDFDREVYEKAYFIFHCGADPLLQLGVM
jgi:hypothetical protein